MVTVRTIFFRLSAASFYCEFERYGFWEKNLGIWKNLHGEGNLVRIDSCRRI
jgi:hypothetical protein